VDHEHWSRDDLAALHESIRRQVGRKFPPPKSHFGETIPRHDATAGRTFWRSLVPGGLTRYWSASLLPFTAEELAQWGFDRGEFDEHYGNVAAQIGLAAREDGLNRYFGRSFATRPPITPTPLIEKLIGAIEGARDARPVAAGINRVAIETRSGHARQCVSCGACFYGCPRHSVFSGAEAGAPRSDRMRITNVPEKVLYARHVSAGYELETPSGRHGPFDRVFCAAGCIGSAELVARSFLERAVAELVDNELFVFPLLYLGRGQRPHDGYVAIANALVGLLPDGGGERYAEAHVAPIPDLLTRFYLPAALDRTAVRLARWLRGRSLLVKLYLHSETAPRFKVVPSPTDVRIEKTADGKGTPKLARLLERLRGALGGSGFWMPRGLPVLRSKTSSHYAGGFEPAAVHAADAATGEVAPRFHVLDSSLMPFSPAQPLTFTSMANARRIVRSVLGA
jgi:ferredoxin